MKLVGRVIKSSEDRFSKDLITYLLSSLSVGFSLSIFLNWVSVFGDNILLKKVQHKEKYLQVKIFTLSDLEYSFFLQKQRIKHSVFQRPKKQLLDLFTSIFKIIFQEIKLEQSFVSKQF